MVGFETLSVTNVGDGSGDLFSLSVTVPISWGTLVVLTRGTANCGGQIS